MRLFSQLLVLFGLLVLAAGVGQAQDSDERDARIRRLEQEVRSLRSQNQNLSAALANANKQAQDANGELEKIRLELEALGTYPLGTDDERLKQAVANRKVLEDKLASLEKASLELKASMQEYLKTAFAADPEARLKVESAIRGLDVELGLGHKPRPQVDLGNLQEAKVISIDGQSGLLVLNAGAKQQVRMGMTFRIMRGNSQIAEAMIAGVRPDISGALVIKVEDTKNAVRLGDIATIKIK
ncbi:hypothetical protein SAMN02745181_3694 [Rubritalea squalenifaciens DSM 18772]|uniref:Uncharacterized protein n=1 Tax=Rubritalea squalenifaciens DSM 18772 TaxID=1123071 RepID=A0A1M6RVI5_9BACT|nr:hypothetical protein SAMN02745181_3694 [Rubritalea squalenifaciens DSM 18772]